MFESGLVDIYRQRTLRRMKLADAEHHHDEGHEGDHHHESHHEEEPLVKPIILGNLVAAFTLYSALMLVAVVAFLSERAAAVVGQR